MESELRGRDGRRRIAVDAKGRELDQEMADYLIPESERATAHLLIGRLLASNTVVMICPSGLVWRIKFWAGS